MILFVVCKDCLKKPVSGCAVLLLFLHIILLDTLEKLDSIYISDIILPVTD